MVYTPDLQILLLERVKPSQFWQSVTGSQELNENLAETAAREIREETGIHIAADALTDHRLGNRFVIPPQWRSSYGAGVTHNTEHVFSTCIESAQVPSLNPSEHHAWQWLPWQEAARTVWSWTNRDAIRLIARATIAKACRAGDPETTQAKRVTI